MEQTSFWPTGPRTRLLQDAVGQLVLGKGLARLRALEL